MATKRSVGNDVAKVTQDVESFTFAELLNTAAKGDIQAVDVAEFDTDDGFAFVANKDQLVDSKFIIIAADFFVSEKFGEGVKVKAVTDKENRIKFVDFSTGIKEQMKAIVNADGHLPEGTVIGCLNGLIRSDYPANDDRPAGTTFYLDTQGGALPTGTL